jgi:hypothetical protein
MKRFVLLTGALVSALALAGCGPTREDRTVSGAVVGGAAGALIGGAATGRAGGALVGGLVGATAGAVVGANSPPPRRCVAVRYDYYGNQYCSRWARPRYY